MINYRNKVVWITGASSGMGEATAYRFAREGALLIVTARKKEILEKVAAQCKQLGATDAKALPYDLSDLDGLPNLAEEAWNTFGRIDVLYNNAGISQRGSTIDTEMQVIRKVMDVDYFAPVIITKTILPKMVAQGGGQLACTTSIAGVFGSKHRCAYCSAKSAMYRFFETIGVEYYDQNIRVTVLIPGRVQTNISLHALEANGKEHGKMDAGQAKGISSEKAGNIIYKAIARRKREKLVGGMELLMVYFKRFIPGLCFTISRKINAM